MQISLSFKNFDSSDALKDHIHEKFDRLDKMLDSPAEAHIVLSIEKLRNIVDINLTSDKLRIHGKEASEKNMYSAIDALSDNIKLQIRKFKDKQRRHLAGDKQSIKTNQSEFDAPDNLKDN